MIQQLRFSKKDLFKLARTPINEQIAVLELVFSNPLHGWSATSNQSVSLARVAAKLTSLRFGKICRKHCSSRGCVRFRNRDESIQRSYVKGAWQKLRNKLVWYSNQGSLF